MLQIWLPAIAAYSQISKNAIGKKSFSNEEVIGENYAHFEEKHKSFYDNGIEVLERHRNGKIYLDGNYVDE